MKEKKGSILNQVVAHIIIVAIIFSIFILAVSGRVNSRDFKQQVIEKQIALLIDASSNGFSFEIPKSNFAGTIDKIEIRDGRVFVTFSGLRSTKGHPYFTSYFVGVKDMGDKFLVFVE